MRAAVLMAAVGVGVAGCVPPMHVPPKPGHPAALVKFRINHLGKRLGQMTFRLLVDDRRVPHGEIAYHGPSATWTRVKPGWRRVDVGTWFVYAQPYTEHYTQMKSYPCGNRTCTRTEYKTRQSTRYVARGACFVAALLLAQEGHTYLLSYNYLGERACSLTCHEQVVPRPGQVRLVPCRSFRPGEAAGLW